VVENIIHKVDMIHKTALVAENRVYIIFHNYFVMKNLYSQKITRKWLWKFRQSIYKKL